MRPMNLLVAAALPLLTAAAQAEVVIEMVHVGDAGNTGEFDATWGIWLGGVAYDFNIAKCEVTAGQYTEFLNAVAATDTHSLYDPQMSSWDRGCGIEQLGAPGGYSYTVPAERANRPVNYMTFWDCCRFVNWLHNGQPTGGQDVSSTEDGAYYLGGVTDPNNVSVTRKPDAAFFIPTEDEWYKAAYYDGGAEVYYDYPTGTDAIPDNDVVDPDPGNNANFLIGSSDFSLGAPYWTTEVGEFENSASPYGTFDQGGNLFEWNETILSIPLPQYRGVRGGNAWAWESAMVSSYRTASPAWTTNERHGFRVGAPVAAGCAGDIDGDGDTDLSDLAALLASYGKCPGDPGYNPACNLSENDPPDGCVDLSDLAFLLSDYNCGL